MQTIRRPAPPIDHTTLHAIRDQEPTSLLGSREGMELELGDSEGLLDGDMALVCLMVDGSVIGGRRTERKKERW